MLRLLHCNVGKEWIQSLWKQGRVVKGWPGGSEHTRSRRWVVFPIWRLRRMLQASCALRFASVGDLVVATKGLVIGGLLSMIAAICLLSHEEERFLQQALDGSINLPEGWRIDELFFGMRYVDDLLMVSYTVCHTCLQQFLTEIYSVQFSVNPEEQEQTWTDVVFRADPVSGTIEWTAKLAAVKCESVESFFFLACGLFSCLWKTLFLFFCWLMAFNLETICEGSVRGAGRSKNAPADLLEDINKPLS